jgi:hypothetical protein
VRAGQTGSPGRRSSGRRSRTPVGVTLGGGRATGRSRRRLALPVTKNSFGVSQIREVSRIATFLASQVSDRLRAPAAIDRGRRRAGASAVLEPRMLPRDERRTIARMLDQAEHRRCLSVNAPIRARHISFQTGFNLDGRGWVCRTGQWRPRLSNDWWADCCRGRGSRDDKG